MNDLLSYPDENLTVKLADQVCYSDKELSLCKMQYAQISTIYTKQ
jgi:hypothetical protein